MGRVINLRGVYGKSEFIPWPRPSNDALLKAGQNIGAQVGKFLEAEFYLIKVFIWLI